MENYDRALELLSAVRKDMDLLPVIHDWYWKMLLESGFTEAWLGKGDLGQARVSAQLFLEVAQQTSEHTWQALAWEANARIAMAQRIGFRVETLQAFGGRYSSRVSRGSR
jgi:hypothetical protein